MELRKKGAHKFSSINHLSLTNLIFSIGSASVATIWAIYLESFLHSQSYVGFLSSALTIIALISFLFITPLIEKKSEIRLYTIALIFYLISYILFAIFPNIYVIIFLGVVLAVISSLRIDCFGILVRENSEDKKVAESEGLIYTSYNLAWFIGPIIAGFISSRYGLNKLFLFAAFTIFISLIFFKSSKIKEQKYRKNIDKNMFKILKEFFRKKDRRDAYIVSGGINFWWALIYTYIPMQMVDTGLSEAMVGYFLAAVIIPLILTEYYFGKLSEKKGFKKIFVIGYLILAASAITSFFISNLYLTLLILALASFGAGMLESTTEAYFFDVITKKQREKYYGIYNTTIDVNIFFATSISALLLLLLPFRSIFILFSIAMLIFAIKSSRIRNVIESKRH